MLIKIKNETLNNYKKITKNFRIDQICVHFLCISNIKCYLKNN